MDLLPPTAALAVLFIVLSMMTAFYAWRCHTQAFEALCRLKAAEGALKNQKESIMILQRENAQLRRQVTPPPLPHERDFGGPH